jgi:HK97 family phage major capsid protein/HK97 family phage prohead protease
VFFPFAGGPSVTQTLIRHFSIEQRSSAGNGEPVPVVISSTAPVDRGGYVEVLDHSPDAIDMSRARDGLPLIEGHDQSRAPIGRVTDLTTDGTRLRGRVRFGSSARARELLADVQAGIVTGLSVGYQINETRQQGGALVATRWTPMEVSAVAVPADQQAGFYRAAAISNSPTPGDHTMETLSTNDSTALSRSQRRAAGNAAQSEQERIAAIRNVVSGYSSQMDDTGNAIAEDLIQNGGSHTVLQHYLLNRVRYSRPPLPHGNVPSLGSAPSSLDLSRQDLSRYSLLRAVRAAAYGKENRRLIDDAAFEYEVSAAMAQRAGITPKGLMVPMEAFFGTRDMTVGTTSAGGHLVATELMAGRFINTLDAVPQVVALGATMLTGLTGNVAIPRMTSGTAPAWLSAEGGTYTETQPAFDQVTLTPKDVAAMTDLSRRLLQQSTPAADELVRSDLAKRIAAAIDLAAINGTGSSGQPLGILGTAGIGSVAGGTNGAAPSWTNVTKLIQEVAVDNALSGNLGFLTNAAAAATLLRTEKATGTGLFVWEAGRMAAEGTVAGYRAAISNNVPSNLTKGTASGVCSAIVFGNWADLLIGMWGGVDIVVDPYTFSSTGGLRITAAATVDVAVRHPQSFAAITDVLTT